MRIPTTRTRTSASFTMRTCWSALTYAFSPTLSNCMSSAMSWFDTKMDKGPASAKNPNLVTCVTTASSTSPLNGRNATHPYSTWNLARAVPSSVIIPSLMLLMAVTRTMNPCRPVQLPSTSFFSFSCNTSRMFRPKCRASRMMFLSRLMWKNISPRTARANALLRTPFALQLPLAKGCLGFRVMISTRHAPSPQHATVRKPLRLTSIPTRRRQREGDTTTLLLFARSRRETDGSPFQAGCSLTLTEGTPLGN
mmetsp:Transcript_28314/g.45348  ORF Transcript_28314/g.45348 Transcript_28314/m.45348 type:complete len:252 (+) Transcript_28314:309-1064(+)